MHKQTKRNRHDFGSRREPPPKQKKERLRDIFRGGAEELERTVLAPQLQLSGNLELFVEGCKEVLEYDDNRIRLRLPKQVLIVTGQRLSIPEYGASAITIRGSIQSIEWE